MLYIMYRLPLFDRRQQQSPVAVANPVLPLRQQQSRQQQQPHLMDEGRAV